MGTITISTAGFADTPAATPPNWPAGVGYFGITPTNGTRVATITDQELLSLITWLAATHTPQGTPQSPTTTSAAGLLSAWVSNFFTDTKLAVQRYFTVPATAPPPINLN